METKIKEPEISIEDATRWARALRSGKYKQTKGVLQNKRGVCCLGAGCIVFTERRKLERDCFKHLHGINVVDQMNAPEWLKGINKDLKRRLGKSFASLNDDEGFTFLDIANVIELVYIYNRDTNWTIDPSWEPLKEN